MKKTAILTYLIALTFLLLSGCKHETTPPTINDNTDIPLNICFQEDILPMIQSNCAYSGCHSAGDEEPDLSNYSNIMKLVKTGDPQNSRLYKEAIGSFMPPSPKTPLNLQQVTLIYGWIKQGALNTACLCDTNIFTYSGAVSRIIQTNCLGCHSGTSPSGNLSLKTFPDIYNAVNSRNLYARITSITNPMPTTGLMSACKIRQIKLWIDDGIKNN